MDSWNKGTHGRSGLIDKVRASKFTEAEVEAMILDFLRVHVASGTAPLAGNTVHQDRRFMARYMPAFDSYLHYRIVDVSTLKELARRWRPEVLAGVVKESKHEALADVYESIEELRHYRRTFLRADPVAPDPGDLPGPRGVSFGDGRTRIRCSAKRAQTRSVESPYTTLRRRPTELASAK